MAVMEDSYEDETERKQHSNAIEMLARDLGISVDEMSQLYETELKKLKQDATIKDFLTVIVSRRVREIIKKMIARGEFL